MKNKRSKEVKILVSTCLLGVSTQWNENCKKIDDLITLVRQGKAVFLCPEQLGGLPTPREPAEIEEGKTAKDVLKGKGRVLTNTGKDVTKEFVAGAQRLLHFCQDLGIETAILKARSPSCGSNQIYNGTFTGTKKYGKGITAELLEQNGIKVCSEENFLENLDITS